ncbi:methyltransferase domain-containing protein [Muricauda sp. SCSIO 64092]|uniref:methyltransferase domain-containing protein n=1 Tax=Allomuricauda sp. SCSIO 64092 TaxID=2908842 RepID=UPI001FF43417|nr:methyltransferase domain-containing protein [Muricauda sp. SCSIO 64092]UOY06465.1 methyltransferase domain-containing protein [Muricauda sp. SCSIO 64092]
MDISIRSSEVELMDRPGLDKKSLTNALKDINFCNTWLGGYRLTINAVLDLIKSDRGKSYTILDVGCGDGEMLRKLSKTLHDKGISHRLVGIDINKTILGIAEEKSQDFLDIGYRYSDILTDDSLDCDILLCTLTLHHLKQKEIPLFLNRFVAIARVGVVINDLQRSRVAHFLFKIFRAVFLKSKIAKNDGLVSIRRAFKKEELLRMSKRITGASHRISWKWAFRYVWILKPQLQG